MNAATCAWPLYVELCSDMVLLHSERWLKSPWARLDALLAVWAKTPLYLLPEKYSPAVALPDGTLKEAKEEAKEAAEPLSFGAEEPLTISRPSEGLSTPSQLLIDLAERAQEVEPPGAGKVQKPTLAVKRLV